MASKALPADSYSFGFQQGMIGNVHFVAIPANASASAGAKVVANFLLSPQAQIRKATRLTGAIPLCWILKNSRRQRRINCASLCRLSFRQRSLNHMPPG